MNPKNMTIEEQTEITLKAATLDMIDAGVRTMKATRLESRMRDQAKLMGLETPAWPVFVGVAQRLGYVFVRSGVLADFDVNFPALVRKPKFRSICEIQDELRKHFEDESATMNDSECDRLYRAAHHVREEDDTDLEAVEAWVVAVLSGGK